MEHSEIDFARGLKSLAGAGLFYGLTFLWGFVNSEWLYWPGVSFLIFIAGFTSLFCSVRMLFTGKRTISGDIIWIGITYLAMTGVFRILSWPGGTIMGFYGVPNLIIIVAAIIYLKQMPQELSWSRKALGAWSIGIPLVTCTLWYAMHVYQIYYSSLDSFEPAIPYSDYCVEYYQLAMMKSRILKLGSGIAFFAFSLPLYIVARKHSK